MNNRQLLLLLAGLTCVGTAYASDDSTQDVLTLDDVVVVTATRTETALSDALSAVRVISREQIDRSQARDLGDLLRFVAGIDVARTGGPGQQTSVFIRGSESNHTLVLVDGVRINPGTIGVAAVQNISPALIERVEIVTGPRSSLYGSDAIGGVINVITRAGSGGAARDLTVRAGGDNQREIAANVSGADDQLRWGAGVNWQRSGGFPTRAASDVDRGYDNLSASFNVGTDIAGTSIDARHWQAEGTTEYADFFATPVAQDYTNSASAIVVGRTFGDDWTSRLTLSRIHDDIAQNESPDFLQTTRLSADWQNTIRVGDSQTVVAGLYRFAEDAESLSFGTAFSERINVSAAYLQNQFRWSRVNTLLALRLTDHDAFGSELTWNAEIGVPVAQHWIVQLNAGRAFRAPDASDRFGFGGNPSLRAEVSLQQQARLIYRATGNWQVSLEYFRNDIDDLIDFDFSTFTLSNISAAEIRGTELRGEWRNADWQIELALLSQRAENAADGSRLLRRADRSATLSATRLFGAHSVVLSVRADGDREDFGNQRLPGYVLATLGAQYRLSRHWQLSAQVDNVLDTRYQTAASFNTQDRTSSLQVRYTW